MTTTREKSGDVRLRKKCRAVRSIANGTPNRASARSEKRLSRQKPTGEKRSLTYIQHQALRKRPLVIVTAAKNLSSCRRSFASARMTTSSCWVFSTKPCCNCRARERSGNATTCLATCRTFGTDRYVVFRQHDVRDFQSFFVIYKALKSEGGVKARM